MPGDRSPLPMLLYLLNPIFLLMALAAQFLTYGKQNEVKLQQLSFGFAWRVRIWLLLMRLRGFYVLVLDGLRSASEQAALHRQDARNPPLPGDHGTGNAIDVRVYNKVGAVVLQKATPAAQWRPVYVLAAFCGIANGSLFSGYPDNNHFFIRPGSEYFRALLNSFKK